MIDEVTKVTQAACIGSNASLLGQVSKLVSGNFAVVHWLELGEHSSLEGIPGVNALT